MSIVYRCFSEKKEAFRQESEALVRTFKSQLSISGLKEIRIFSRYDVQGISDGLYAEARVNVFSEPQCDDCYDELLPKMEYSYLLAVESLPGQYDQRADSCAQCIQILSSGERPVVKTAKIYVFFGELSLRDKDMIDAYLINPVESRKASPEKPDTLEVPYDEPADVSVLEGFCAMTDKELIELRRSLGLAMDDADIFFLRDYFKESERRDPTFTEIKMIDTYWSDHCRHTTFRTIIRGTDISDKTVSRAFNSYLEANREIYGERAAQRPITLMDIATCGVKLLKKRGELKRLDESEEINACSVHVEVDTDDGTEDWLLMFKNETHNHPTEIEPFGGAATCLGGAIRDPLSGRSYVYQAMRVTGCGDPRVPIEDTIVGKLPQRRLTQTAAAGYSSYGNQIGLATGLVHEIYHPKYVAKRLEIGAVVGAAPAENVRRERPVKGDVVILLGGRTGRDGCGGATGSSKTHSVESLKSCGAEVQKGNPTEERKLQRLFRNKDVTRLIKRCNDFGAGGVSVAVGELADSLDINLDLVPKKYEGLDGTELAISESQERMAVVVDSADADKFIGYAKTENLEATKVAVVTDTGRLKMTWRGKTIVDVSRDFLNSNGAAKYADVSVPCLRENVGNDEDGNFIERAKALLSDLNVCSQRGLGERFDGSIGASAVISPYGGKTGIAPEQIMVSKFPVLGKNTRKVSAMSFGFDPYISDVNPFLGASYAVCESVSRLVAAGFARSECYLTFQEYFERLNNDSKRWGKPFSALLGAFEAQCGLNIASIGGKDSMSGSYMDMDVPPTLVSFCVASGDADRINPSTFRAEGNPVCLFSVPAKEDGSPDYEGLCRMYSEFGRLSSEGKVLSARALGFGGVFEAAFNMCAGSDIGFEFDKGFKGAFAKNYGALIAEFAECPNGAELVGYTSSDKSISKNGEKLRLSEAVALWESVLEDVFPVNAAAKHEPVENICFGDRGITHCTYVSPAPLAVIPVFPGTNCEYDTARAIERAGGKAEVIVIRNLNSSMLSESVEVISNAIRRAQTVVIPGGFSGGDEPDGSGKFIAAFFRNPSVTDAVHELLYKRDGLMLGICNGFQALIKLGLVPFGRIVEMTEKCPTLTFNTIGRHQARYVSTRVASVKSPWLSLCDTGDVHSVPISHGEGRFVASKDVMDKLIENGQIAFQYCGSDGNASMDILHNPNGSMCAVEGITSPDGRVLGKMAHTERSGIDIGRNITGNLGQPIFEAGVKYFK